MLKLEPPVHLQNPESEDHARYILDVASKPGFNFSPVSKSAVL